MKDYIVEKHEVKLDGTWYVVEPILNTENKIMFIDGKVFFGRFDKKLFIFNFNAESVKRNR